MSPGGPVLVTGGAGYVGSHIAWALLDSGRSVTVLDDLSTGVRNLVPPGAQFVQGSIADAALAEKLMVERNIEAVIHVAGSAAVMESLQSPLSYYENNVVGSLALLRAATMAGVRRFIFSSTAAVYRPDGCRALNEQDATGPLSPYGWSKLMFERMLADVGRAQRIDWLALRYFNVAGADPMGRSGQAAREATHLIKVVCEVALGRRPFLEVFGDDHPTADGTGVRDYIHVSDLADVHVEALSYLERRGESRVLNCGYGAPVSVRDVLAATERITGAAIPWTLRPKRSGDASYMVADNAAVREMFGWRPRFADIDAIVASALAWERARLGREG